MSTEFSVNNMKKWIKEIRNLRLSFAICDFSVDYNIIDVINIVNIHRL